MRGPIYTGRMLEWRQVATGVYIVNTHIFYNEHGPPSNLRTKIFDEPFVTIPDAHIFEERVIIQGFF